MIKEEITNLEALITHKKFPKIDTALRRGVRIDQTDELYTFLAGQIELFSEFFDLYEARVIHNPDGYFYLVSEGKTIKTRTLEKVEMDVGQVLCSLRLSPDVASNGYVISEQELRAAIEAHLSPQKIKKLLNIKASRPNEMTSARELSTRIEEALTTLRKLGFISREQEQIQLYPALNAFLGPARKGEDTMSYLASHDNQAASFPDFAEDE